MEAEKVSKAIRKEGATVLARVVLFLFYYVTLIVIGLSLLAGAAWVTYSIPGFLGTLDHLNYRLLIAGLIAFGAMWWFCIQIGFYLVKPLFVPAKMSNDNQLEIMESDCPELFSMIREVSQATGNKMPRHVYLSPEVNACVFYDKVSILSVFLPTRKNLTVGIGLLHGMNKSEVKAILSHEFGHFSQQSMRIGTITYRLLLIIRTMIAYAREQQEKDAEARTLEDYKWYLHLAVYPISFITKRTISFYNWIEKKNRSLSRYMEFEADTVACKVAGARAQISSLCKIETLSERYSAYENAIANILGKGYFIPGYWEGYVFVYEQIAKSENLFVDKDTLLDAPIGDNAKFPSRISIVDGWNTHPTLYERIDNARQYISPTEAPRDEDPADLVGIKTLNAVGETQQHFIASHLQEPVEWQDLSAIDQKDFESSFMSNYGERLRLCFLFVFLNMRIHGFPLPDENEIKNENVDNPFTEMNRNLILEYNQGGEDWQVLNQIKSGDIDAKRFMYAGKLYSNADEPLALQDEYLKPLHKRKCDLDVEIYKFLCQNTEEKHKVDVVYWTIMYANSASQTFDPISDNAKEARDGLAFYQSQDSDATLPSQVNEALSRGLWRFLKDFDFDTTSGLFENATLDGIPLSIVMSGWKRIALQKHLPSLSDKDLLNMIGEVSGFLNYMLEAGYSEWKKMIIQTYDSQVMRK